MLRSIKCPHCGQVTKVGDEAGGKRVECPSCGKAFLAPRAAAAPPKPAGPPPAASPTRVWYVNIDGRNDGPHAQETILEQIKTGKLDARTLAWREGMGDWLPLGETAEFRGAFATPPPVKPHHPHRGRDAAHEREPRSRYSATWARRDVTIGLWLAGGLCLVALIGLLVVLSRKPRDQAPDTGPKWRPILTTPPGSLPATATGSGTTLTHGPRPDHTPTKVVRPEASGKELLAALVADLDKGFADAISAHKRGQRKPILRFAAKLKDHAEKIGARNWGGYKNETDSLVSNLKNAGQGIEQMIKDPSKDAWDIPAGMDEQKRAKILGFDDVKWLENWQNILAESIKKVRSKGLDF